jgi:filamentous hemagglutinin family protein
MKGVPYRSVVVAKFLRFLLLPMALLANPTGEKVVFGEAVVDRVGDDVMNVVQTSSQAIIEWDSFSIAEGQRAHFIQPDANSSVLNRVTGSNLTEIYGKMEGNGQIFLVNPYGVLVGESGVIDCANFLAASLDMDNQAFLEGRDFAFRSDGGEAKVVNRGSIRAFGGPLYLIGSNVENSGTLEAAMEQVYVITGDDIHVAALDRPKVMIRPKVTVHREALHSPYMLAVNRDGMEDANVVRREGGRVFLEDQTSASYQFVNVPNVPYKDGGGFVEETLDGLQELRSLIPERLWYQEFAWLIDVPGFQMAASNLANHQRSFAGSRAAISVGTPEYYLLHATISGEPIRIMDRYLEFLDSPYWKNPDMLRYLYYLQHNFSKVPR